MANIEMKIVYEKNGDVVVYFPPSDDGFKLKFEQENSKFPSATHDIPRGGGTFRLLFSLKSWR